MTDPAIITLDSPADQTIALAELTKRLRRHELGRAGLNLVTSPEHDDAEAALDALAAAPPHTALVS